MSDKSKVPKRNNWVFGNIYDSINEEYSMSDLINYYIGYMSSKCLMMFKWNNLPDGMNSYDVEKFPVSFLTDREYGTYNNKHNQSPDNRAVKGCRCNDNYS